MAKNEKSLPETPTYQEDPIFRESFKNLSKNSQDMATLNLESNPNLLETIQFHPEMLDTFMDTLKLQMSPQLRDAKTDLTNELANLGALESSTTANAMGRLDEQFLNTLQVQSGQFGLETMMKAMENRINITGMGMQGLGEASRVGVQAESNLNQFNLQNYENQVAKSIYDQQNKAGGFMGALQGGIGGAMSGFVMSGGNPLGALAGGVAGGGLGYFGNQSTGSSILNMGIGAGASGGMKGLSGGLGTQVTGAPNKTASNNLFRNTPVGIGAGTNYGKSQALWGF